MLIIRTTGGGGWKKQKEFVIIKENYPAEMAGLRQRLKVDSSVKRDIKAPMGFVGTR